MSSVIQYRLVFIDRTADNYHLSTINKVFKGWDEAVKYAIDTLEAKHKDIPITKQGLTNIVDDMIGTLHTRGCWLYQGKSGNVKLIVLVLQEDLR